MATGFDFSVFNTPNSCTNNDYNLCGCINRLSIALKYYSLLDIINNEKHKDIFIHFALNIYQSMLDDYTHLVTQHSHQIHDINQFICDSDTLQYNDCNINNCHFTLRHQRVEQQQTSLDVKRTNNSSQIQH